MSTTYEDSKTKNTRAIRAKPLLQHCNYQSTAFPTQSLMLQHTWGQFLIAHGPCSAQSELQMKGRTIREAEVAELQISLFYCAVLKGSWQIALAWATRLQTILTLVYTPAVPSCLKTYSAVILTTTMVREFFFFLLYYYNYFLLQGSSKHLTISCESLSPVLNSRREKLSARASSQCSMASYGR